MSLSAHMYAKQAIFLVSGHTQAYHQSLIWLMRTSLAKWNVLAGMLTRFQDVKEEAEGYWLKPSHGKLPPELDGTYFK